MCFLNILNVRFSNQVQNESVFRKRGMVKDVTLLLFGGTPIQMAYRGTSFAGYIGLWTGQSPKKFTVSGDQRGKSAPSLSSQKGSANLFFFLFLFLGGEIICLFPLVRH